MSPSVPVVLSLAAFAMVLPLTVYYLSGFGGRAGAKQLAASFAAQRALVLGKEMPAMELRVVHRWRTSVMTDRHGVIYAIDANWLCRTNDGLFVVAIGQGSAEAAKAFLSLGEQPPLTIGWTWRSLSDERVRHMLVPTPRIYRKVFGSAP